MCDRLIKSSHAFSFVLLNESREFPMEQQQHDEDKFIPDDWQATTIIYPEARSRFGPAVVDTDTHLFGSQATTQQSSRYDAVLKGRIEIALNVQHLTFARPLATEMAFETQYYYRFWTLEVGPTLRLEFDYGKTPPQDNDEILEQVAQFVTVSLGEPDYPVKWPPEQCIEWLEWLNRTCNNLLQEQGGVSYTVCHYVEQQAVIDFFKTIVLPDCNELLLVLFEGVVTTTSSTTSDFDYTSVESLVASLRDHGGQGVMLHHPMVDEHHATSDYHTIHTLPFPAKQRLWPFVYRWQEWFVYTTSPCPICLEAVVQLNLVELPSCLHHYCRQCLGLYFASVISELQLHRDNPFRCPDCRVGLPIVGFVKRHLTEDQMQAVRDWYRNLKQPPCTSLPGCLNQSCGGHSLRHTAVDSQLVQCDDCRRQWCERCLRRVQPSQVIATENGILTHDNCQEATTLQFCQRYLAAGPAAKALCEKKWPWIRTFAPSRVEDASIQAWWQTQGQVCPICKTGVERIKGCFHMHCTCGAHFCYECGDELHYPFYGTHHCWEL